MAENNSEENLGSCPRCGKSRTHQKFYEPPFKIVKCNSCHLVFLGNPPDSSVLYEDYYSDDPNPADYRTGFNDTSLRELYTINCRRLDLLKRLAPEGKLLDIGCGRGFFLKTALDNGYKVRGIDVSEKATVYSRKFFRVETECLPLEKLSGEKYDIITLWHVLENFPDPFIVLKQIRDMLSDRGVCMVEVPNLNSLKFIVARNKWHGGNHPLYHRTFFTASTLSKSLLDAGFSKIKRVNLSYHVPGRSKAYWTAKAALNHFAFDSFLDFAAWK